MDAVHDFFLSLLSDGCSQLGNWRGEGTLAAYMVVSVQRRCLSRLRTDARRRHILPELAAKLHGGALPEYERVTLKTALERLCERDRSVLRMFFFEGFAYGEIAVRWGMSENTVASLLSRAKVRLRRASANGVFAKEIDRS